MAVAYVMYKIVITKGENGTEYCLKGYDIMLPEATYMNHSIADAYIYAHVIEDFYIMNRVILKHYPEYEQTIKDFFFRDNRWIAFNMFFTSKVIFNEYCEWLFPILQD